MHLIRLLEKDDSVQAFNDQSCKSYKNCTFELLTFLKKLQHLEKGCALTPHFENRVAGTSLTNSIFAWSSKNESNDLKIAQLQSSFCSSVNSLSGGTAIELNMFIRFSIKTFTNYTIYI